MDTHYANQIENRLKISTQIDGCQRMFSSFVKRKSLDIKDELSLLRAIKLLLNEEEKAIQENNKGSNIPNHDCLTMAIITCTLAHRYGYSVNIGRPNLLSRYYHSVIIMSDGVLFKVTGKRRDYRVKKLSVNAVVFRLSCFNPVISFFDALKK